MRVRRCEGCGRAARTNKTWTEELKDAVTIGHLAVTVHETEIPGQWIAHLVEIDMMAQGEGPLDALRALVGAVEMLLEDEAREAVPS